VLSKSALIRTRQKRYIQLTESMYFVPPVTVAPVPLVTFYTHANIRRRSASNEVRAQRPALGNSKIPPNRTEIVQSHTERRISHTTLRPFLTEMKWLALRRSSSAPFRFTEFHHHIYKFATNTATNTEQYQSKLHQQKHDEPSYVSYSLLPPPTFPCWDTRLLVYRSLRYFYRSWYAESNTHSAHHAPHAQFV
jgi:hypothetical protein